MGSATEQPLGDPQLFRWGIETITFSGGEAIAVPRDALTVLIGPNNSGKSTALAELSLRINPYNARPERVISDVSFYLEGSGEDFKAWLSTRYTRFDSGGVSKWVGLAGTVESQSIPNDLRNDVLGGHFQGFLSHSLDPNMRLSDHSASRIELHSQRPNQYIHVLQSDDRLASRVSNEVRRAFGVGLVIHWAAVSPRFHLGEEPERTVENDRASVRYGRAVDALPTLKEAGDGIRCFVSCLLALECGSQPVLIIDEPDVFLAPPQARRLGRLLAASAHSNRRQVIVATHSSDLIQGALSAQGKVAVCRVTRDDRANHAHLLNSGRLTDLTRKPLLRSSAAIDGVFHHGVVVCEADSDCRFYQALLDRLEVKKQIGGPLDLYFVPAGGKGELSTLAQAYSCLRVPVAVIADLDLLRNEAELRNVVAGLGQDPSAVEKLAKQVRTAIGSIPPSTGYDQFREALSRILADTGTTKMLETSHRKQLSDLVRDTADWSEAKKYGLLKLTGGQLQMAKQLMEVLAHLGLFLVPKGELERWWPGGPAGSKTEWFIAAMKRLDEDSGSFPEAELFAARVASSFGKRTTLDLSRWLGV